MSYPINDRYLDYAYAITHITIAIEYLRFVDWCSKHGMFVGESHKTKVLKFYNELRGATKRGAVLSPEAQDFVDHIWSQVHGRQNMYMAFAREAGVTLPEPTGYVTYLYFNADDMSTRLIYSGVTSREEAIEKLKADFPEERFKDVSEIKFAYPFERRI